MDCAGCCVRAPGQCADFGHHMEAPRGLVMARMQRYEDPVGKTGAGMAIRVILAAMALLACGTMARAAGCDLDQVMGYQVVASRTIQGHLENGKPVYGFEGCEPGRVLVFTDRTGLRCKGSGLAHLELPKAWIFAKSKDDLKLCVGDDLYDVGPLK
jgi:hypothetical protein